MLITISILWNLSVMTLCAHYLLRFYNERRVYNLKEPILLPFEYAGYIVTHFIAECVKRGTGVSLSYEAVVLFIVVFDIGALGVYHLAELFL
jgi:hypothetical protein